VKLHCHRCGDWPGLINSGPRQDRPNVAGLVNVDLVMFLIAFDVHAKTKRETPKIMHPESLLHFILDLPNQALASNDKEIIDVQNAGGDDYTFMLKHQQF
jgi:hypothetical protein